MFLSENWLHFLHFSENSQRHHYAADASVYLVNIKRQIYYAHRQKKMLVVMSILFIYAFVGKLVSLFGKLSAASLCR
jgi:hypothetical protein